MRVDAAKHTCTVGTHALPRSTAHMRKVQAVRDAATWTSLGSRKVVSAANAAARAEEQHNLESDDEHDADLVSEETLVVICADSFCTYIWLFVAGVADGPHHTV